MIALTVSPAVGDASVVTTNQSSIRPHRYSEGEEVTVKVDPDDRDVVWISARPEASSAPVRTRTRATGASSPR